MFKGLWIKDIIIAVGAFIYYCLNGFYQPHSSLADVKFERRNWVSGLLFLLLILVLILWKIIFHYQF